MEDSRIIFMGTPGFAVPALDAMCESGFRPIAVVTAPDRARGRGQKVSYTPVKEAARRLEIESILQPESVKEESFSIDIAGLRADLIVVVAFRILPPSVFSSSRLGAFNLHGSLLPAYRGAAPIHRAVMAGESVTGTTTFFLKEKVDTGNIILQHTMDIGPDETTGEVHDRMMLMGARTVVQTIRMILDGSATTRAQDDSLASGAPKIFRDDCRIRWSSKSIEIHNHIRGLSPFPGAWTMIEGTILKVYRSKLVSAEQDAVVGREERLSDSGSQDYISGAVFCSSDQLFVRTADGWIELLELQIEGRRRMPAKEFLRGNRVKTGDILNP